MNRKQFISLIKNDIKKVDVLLGKINKLKTKKTTPTMGRNEKRIMERISDENYNLDEGLLKNLRRKRRRKKQKKMDVMPRTSMLNKIANKNLDKKQRKALKDIDKKEYNEDIYDDKEKYKMKIEQRINSLKTKIKQKEKELMRLKKELRMAENKIK